MPIDERESGSNRIIGAPGPRGPYENSRKGRNARLDDERSYERLIYDTRNIFGAGVTFRRNKDRKNDISSIL